MVPNFPTDEIKTKQIVVIPTIVFKHPSFILKFVQIRCWAPIQSRYFSIIKLKKPKPIPQHPQIFLNMLLKSSFLSSLILSQLIVFQRMNINMFIFFQTIDSYRYSFIFLLFHYFINYLFKNIL